MRAHDAQPLYLCVCEEDPANEIESREGGWRAAAPPGHPPANADERKEEDEMDWETSQRKTWENQAVFRACIVGDIQGGQE